MTNLTGLPEETGFLDETTPVNKKVLLYKGNALYTILSNGYEQ